MLFLTQRNRPKQRVGRVEQAQARGNDYATVEEAWSGYMSLAEKAIFVYVFKLVRRLMLETLSEQCKN